MKAATTACSALRRLRSYKAYSVEGLGSPCAAAVAVAVHRRHRRRTESGRQTSKVPRRTCRTHLVKKVAVIIHRLVGALSQEY